MPVVLIGDIDRGGVIAQIVGTKAVIAPEDAAMVAGFLVNKFRGDPTLFEAGMRIIAEHTGWPGLGLVPHFAAGRRGCPPRMPWRLRHSGPGGFARAASWSRCRCCRRSAISTISIRCGSSRTSISSWSGPAKPCRLADLVILPGSKATIADLAALRRNGWDIDILAHARRGGRVLGLCGGYQMLGRSIADPEGIEGPPGGCDGLGLLDVETVLGGDKRLRAVEGISVADGVPFAGYEMHVGETSGPDCARPLLRFADGTPDGATSADGRIQAAYVHGLLRR